MISLSGLPRPVTSAARGYHSARRDVPAGFALQDFSHDLDVLARPAERLAVRHSVPAFDDLRSGNAEPEQHSSARQQIDRRRSHRGHRRRRAVICIIAVPTLIFSVFAASQTSGVTASDP